MLDDKVLLTAVKGLPTAKRHAAHSRAAILAAASELFAEQGYASTTLEEVGTRAGFSRGTPAYFYGSKQRLYQAVLEHAFTRAHQALAGARDEAEEAGLTGVDAFRHALGAYIDFLVDQPQFVRLVEWEALRHGAGLGRTTPHLETVMTVLEQIGEALSDQLPVGFDLTQLMLSVAGLCWFPIAHRETLGMVLGVDALSPQFVEARKEHVTELVMNGISGFSRREES